MASPNSCSASELASVVAAKVIPVMNITAARGTVHLYILKRLKAVSKLKIPRTGRWGGAVELAMTK